jgi:TPR repeat protein
VGLDYEEAARWLKAAGEAGNKVAQADLANLVFDGTAATGEAAHIVAWFAEAAGTGDLVAAFNLGLSLVKGLGTERDEERAALWMRRAGEGVPEAQLVFARMLTEGRGVTPDLEAARGWFARAANAGLNDARVALAEMLANGRGGPADRPSALLLFAQAAAEGHSGAMFALGAFNAGGHGFPAHRETAQHWFREAAELGHGWAQLMLGRYLAQGAVGEPDCTQARIWLERALAQGVAEAEGELARLG